MKKITLFITLLLFSIAAGAQTDIKTLEGKTSSQITRVTGTPKSTDFGDSFTYVDIYEYSDTRFGINRNSKSLEFFVTKSSKYCVLSGLISGGIRVGDDISKLKNFNFANTAYGRKKSSNAFKSNPKVIHDLMGYASNYVIFEDEYNTIYITIKNNKVVAWGFSSKGDEPYTPYDGTIKIW